MAPPTFKTKLPLRIANPSRKWGVSKLPLSNANRSRSLVFRAATKLESAGEQEDTETRFSESRKSPNSSSIISDNRKYDLLFDTLYGAFVVAGSIPSFEADESAEVSAGNGLTQVAAVASMNSPEEWPAVIASLGPGDRLELRESELSLTQAFVTAVEKKPDGKLISSEAFVKRGRLLPWHTRAARHCGLTKTPLEIIRRSLLEKRYESTGGWIAKHYPSLLFEGLFPSQATSSKDTVGDRHDVENDSIALADLLASKIVGPPMELIFSLEQMGAPIKYNSAHFFRDSFYFYSDQPGEVKIVSWEELMGSGGTVSVDDKDYDTLVDLAHRFMSDAIVRVEYTLGYQLV